MTTASVKTNPELLAHLLRRAGFGATPKEMDLYSQMEYDDIVDSLMDFSEEDVIPDDMINRFHKDQSDFRSANGAGANWVYRMVMTKTPLREKMCLFWHRVFATASTKLITSRPIINQIAMFRKHGVGTFDNLLLELSKDPAMIMWLDNQDNHGSNINENFGREILELFAMGVGNYTEDDIKETARAFTGWRVVNPEYMSIKMRNNTVRPYGYISWQYEYDEDDHDHGEKTILGETGNWNGEDAVRIICSNKATAEYLARHLYHFFVADELPVPQWPHEEPRDPQAIKVMTDAYFANGHSIEAMLETIFKSDFFKESTYERVKCPAEYVAGCLRVSNTITKPTLLMNEAESVIAYMGQTLLNPPSVEGWHEGAEWINSGSIVERVNFSHKVWSNTNSPEVKDITKRLAFNAELSPHDAVNMCFNLMGILDSDIEESTKNAIVNHSKKKGPIIFGEASTSDRKNAEERISEILGLIASSKEYQRV